MYAKSHIFSKFILLKTLLFFTFYAFSQQYNFVRYSLEKGLVNPHVNDIKQDKYGKLWLATHNGVSVFNGKNFVNYTIENGLLDNFSITLFVDSSIVYVGHKSGISVYFNNRWKKIRLKNKNIEIIKINRVGNKLWLATNNNGIFKYNFQNHKLEHYSYKNGLKSNVIKDIYVDSTEVFAASQKGVSWYDIKTNKFIDTLSNYTIHKLTKYKDKIWFLAKDSGVYKYNYGWLVNYNINNGLLTNNYNDIILTENDEVWLSSNIGVSKITSDVINFTKKNGLPTNNVTCLFADKQQNIFIGTVNQGLVKLSNDNVSIYNQIDDFSINKLNQIYELENGNMLFFFSKEGYLEISNNYNSIYNNNRPNDENSPLLKLLKNKSQRLYCFDSNDSIIYLSTDKGIEIWDKQQSKFLRNSTILKGVEKLCFTNDDYVVWAIKNEKLYKIDCWNNLILDSIVDYKFNTLEVMDDYLFAGTTKGILKIHQNKKETITVNEFYPSNNVMSLKQLGDDIWVGTQFGLYKLINYKNSNNKVVKYADLEYNENISCLKNALQIDSKNNLWLGIEQGVLKIDLSDIDQKKVVVPSFQPIKIKLYLNDINWKIFGFENNEMPPQNFTFNYNQNHLTFEYEAINLKNPEEVFYKFKLEGFDNEWSPETKSNFITYSNLPHGSYTFKVVTSSDQINWSKPLTYTFNIKTPYWLTWWFIVISLLLILTIGYFTFLIINKRKAEKRKTQEIIDYSRMLALEQKSLSSSMNRHFIFNALNSIQYYINSNDKLSANKYLTNFAKLIRKNLDSTANNEVTLSDELEKLKLYLELESMRFNNTFSYEINLSKEVNPAKINIIPMLLQPFVENSIWHGILPSKKEGKIVINIFIKENLLQIEIEDNGVGINESLKIKNKSGHVSKGMALTKSRVELRQKITGKPNKIIGPQQLEEQGKVLGTKVIIQLSI
ncbi:MAG: hypothetical protein Kow0079_03050 [Vicingaceae bacterium]